MQIGIIALAFVLISAILYILATYFYFKALEKNDASIVVVMFQLIPVFSYMFSLIFFGERLGINEILGGLIIISSAIIISFDFGEKSSKNKAIALILMTFSSLLYSLYFICFDVAMRNGNYNAVAFWYQMGLLLVGIALFLIKDYRNSFINMIRKNGKKFISLNVTNEVLNLVANLMVNFANLTIPLAIANTVNGFQGVFVFVIGGIGALLWPKIFVEDLSKKVIIQKGICIVLSIIGLGVMFV